jgi:hypothetical protein
MYWNMPVRTTLPDPVQVYRIPDHVNFRVSPSHLRLTWPGPSRRRWDPVRYESESWAQAKTRMDPLVSPPSRPRRPGPHHHFRCGDTFFRRLPMWSADQSRHYMSRIRGLTHDGGPYPAADLAAPENSGRVISSACKSPFGAKTNCNVNRNARSSDHALIPFQLSKHSCTRQPKI